MRDRNKAIQILKDVELENTSIDIILEKLDLGKLDSKNGNA